MTNPTPSHIPGTVTVPVSDSADDGGAIAVFANASNFAAAQRMANALSQSSLVPAAYQNNLPNVLIALELASRIGASALMVMQSLDIVHGRPSWRASFLIATVNMSGRFTPLRFRWEGSPGSDAWGCRAVAKDRENGEECLGSLITIGLAKAEGWYQRNGSKWRTMPEQLIMYRAAAFWTRVYAPELSLGMQTAEEVIDAVGVPAEEGARPSMASAADLEARLKETSNGASHAPTLDPAAGATEPSPPPSVPGPSLVPAVATGAPPAPQPGPTPARRGRPPKPKEGPPAAPSEALAPAPAGPTCVHCGKPVPGDKATWVADRNGWRHMGCPVAPVPAGPTCWVCSKPVGSDAVQSMSQKGPGLRHPTCAPFGDADPPPPDDLPLAADDVPHERQPGEEG